MEDTRKEGVLKPGARDETAASSWALQPGESAGPGGGVPGSVCFLQLCVKALRPSSWGNLRMIAQRKVSSFFHDSHRKRKKITLSF